MFKEIKEIRKENQEFREELGRIREENKVIKKELEEARLKLDYMENKLDFYEKERKRNNIVVKGLKLDTNNQDMLKEEMSNFLKEHLGMATVIKRVQRIKDNICVIELNNWEEKMKVMENKRKLKDLKDIKVYIDSDLTRNEQEAQKRIREIAGREKNKGNEVRVGFNKLWINGEKWVWNRKAYSIEKWCGDKGQESVRGVKESRDSKN